MTRNTTLHPHQFTQQAAETMSFFGKAPSKPNKIIFDHRRRSPFSINDQEFHLFANLATKQKL
jgi:hypothetical protein